MCVCVCAYVYVCSPHADCPKAGKGARSGFNVDPPPGIVCEGETLGALGCGGVVGGALVRVVSRAGVCGGVALRAVGKKALITPPPRPSSPPPAKEKPPSNLAMCMCVCGVHSPCDPPPPSPEEPPNPPPLPGP